jgi:hypothetical protein
MLVWFLLVFPVSALTEDKTTENILLFVAVLQTSPGVNVRLHVFVVLAFASGISLYYDVHTLRVKTGGGSLWAITGGL